MSATPSIGRHTALLVRLSSCNPPARLVLSQSVRRRIGLGFPLEYGKAGRARPGHPREQAALGGAKCREHVADLRRDSDRRRLQIVTAGQEPDRDINGGPVRLADRRAGIPATNKRAKNVGSRDRAAGPYQPLAAPASHRGAISPRPLRRRSGAGQRGTSAHPLLFSARSLEALRARVSIHAARSAREAPPPHPMSRHRGPRPPGCSSPRELAPALSRVCSKNALAARHEILFVPGACAANRRRRPGSDHPPERSRRGLMSVNTATESSRW